REKAILPSEESIRVCFNKYQTIQLAKTCGVPVPFSIHLKSLKEIEKVKGIVKFPCVIKPSSELEAKFVFYANNQKELNYYLNQSFKILGENSQHGCYSSRIYFWNGGWFFCFI
ncbi:MAG: hypothetical protein ACPLSN_09135, partial [Dictyoglomus turgidum]